MMYLKDFISLAETYGEDAEVYIEISENTLEHLKQRDKPVIVEGNGATLTSMVGKKTWNDKEGIVLRLPIWINK